MTDKVAVKWGGVLQRYRLHQDVVFAVEEMRPGVLVEGLHVLPR